MKKLEKPPHVPHWVRYLYRDVVKTESELIAFARAFPRYTYSHGMRLLNDRFQFRADWETLLKSADNDGRPNSRHLCRELLEGVRDFEDRYNLVGFKAYDFEVLPFRVSRDISVPVKPLTTLNQNGVLEPVFVFGWATFPLTEYQTRLMMTVIEDAVFSLSDYQKSKGHFIVLPRSGESGKRQAQAWQRGDYSLLSQRELGEQLDVYLIALERAKRILRNEKPQSSSRAERWNPRDPNPDQPSLPFF